MEERRCPCGARTTPDPSCDMCDSWQNDPDTGWGGFTDHHLGKHFLSEEERQEWLQAIVSSVEGYDVMGTIYEIASCVCSALTN